MNIEVLHGNKSKIEHGGFLITFNGRRYYCNNLQAAIGILNQLIQKSNIKRSTYLIINPGVKINIKTLDEIYIEITKNEGVFKKTCTWENVIHILNRELGTKAFLPSTEPAPN